jgi:hypothetical protein
MKLTGRLPVLTDVDVIVIQDPGWPMAVCLSVCLPAFDLGISNGLGAVSSASRMHRTL